MADRLECNKEGIGIGFNNNTVGGWSGGWCGGGKLLINF